MSAPVVIVGSGLAGFGVARELRRLDPEVALVILSRDHGGFYSKPMLSNALASGKTATSLVMKSPPQMAAELVAQVRPHTAVEAIDTAQRHLTLSDGSTLAYRDLVLALGADPIPAGLQGTAANQVLSVNDLDDYATFSERLVGISRVVILGAGLIGCEFANDLLNCGVTPVVLDPGSAPLSRLLPPQAGNRFGARLEAAGVKFKWGVTAKAVDTIDGSPELRVTLNNGAQCQAGLVLSAIGLRPRVDLARAAGLHVGRGVITNARLETSAEHVYAVGDCAEVQGHNLPYVMPLMNQARALAATLAGTPTAVVYPAMPVTVKTPACPTVVCVPPPDSTGIWQVEVTDEAVDARNLDAQGRLLGFALLGRATVLKQSLAVQVSGLLS